MKNGNLLLGAALAAGLALGLSTTADAAVSLSGLSVSYFSGFSENPGVGITFSDPGVVVNGSTVVTDAISSIHETADYGGTNSDPNWPGGLIAFGADFTGTINATTAGTYTFAFASDDASYVFINGALVADEIGPHGLPGLADFSVPLTAGANTLEVQYDNDECCQAAIEFQAVPEPAAWALMLVGFSGLGAAVRTRRWQVARTA